jgi:ElaB/YqjD/DUF883 family membrane-anchored ribosome-binding protein
MSQDAPTINKDKFVSDLKAVVVDAEEILKNTADLTGEKVAGLRTRIEARLKDAKARLENVDVILVDKTRAAARVTDDFVREEPWKAVSIAAIVGVALGVLIGRR